MIPDNEPNTPSPQPSGSVEFAHGSLANTQAGAADPLLGRLLDGKYRVESFIGKGGMGMVYKAVYEASGQPVAIKALRPQFVQDTNILHRFQREAIAASRLNHPNIVGLYDFTVTAEAKIFLVMEYLQGRSLSEVMKETGHLEIPRFLHIFLQVCEALDHAHHRGVIHRDLKPANIMLVNERNDPEFVKVVDFGVAKLLADATEGLTQTGEVFGSPIYMSPEQCMGEALDSRSDVYSLGVVMYEALTAEVPLIGEDILETIVKHKLEMPRPLREIAPHLNIPAPLEETVLKALSKKPADRQQSMAELKQNLQDATDPARLRPRQRSITRSFNLSDPEAASAASRARARAVQKQPREQSLLPVLIGIFVLTIVLVGIGIAIVSASKEHSASDRQHAFLPFHKAGRQQSHIQ